MATLVDGCHQLRDGDDGSHLSLTARWYSYTREYSPALLDKTPFRFAEQSALGRAVQYLRKVNGEHGANSGLRLRPTSWRRPAAARPWSQRLWRSRDLARALRTGAADDLERAA